METGKGKPLISILMAVYEPRMDWLREQFVSLNAQTYPNLRLYVRDDCSPNVPYAEIQSLAAQCITAFPYTIARNEKNLGSNSTFERLTREAEGEYFAYCDQDDVWKPEKLTVLQEAIEREDATLVCSDMYIIDKNGKQTADSIKKVRRHHVFRSGEGLAPKLLISNFVTGCTMLVRAEQAKSAIPFCPDMVHDHYLALWCAERGKIVSLPKQLIRYRIHSGNQTLMLAGVTDKESYCRVRIESLIRRLAWLEERFSECETLKEEIVRAYAWAQARKRYFNGDAQAKREIWKGRRFGAAASVFEIVMAGVSDSLFMLVVNLAKKNVI